MGVVSSDTKITRDHHTALSSAMSSPALFWASLPLPSTTFCPRWGVVLSHSCSSPEGLGSRSGNGPCSSLSLLAGALSQTRAATDVRHVGCKSSIWRPQWHLVFFKGNLCCSLTVLWYYCKCLCWKRLKCCSLYLLEGTFSCVLFFLLLTCWFFYNF